MVFFSLNGRAMYKFLIRKRLNSEKKPINLLKVLDVREASGIWLEGLTIIMSQ